jgi:hypothetical protein
VVIESSEVQWHVAIVLLDVHDVLLLLHKVLYGTTKKDISHDLYCQYSINRGDYNYPLSTTYGRNPILAASWTGVNSRKLSRVGSAPASSKMETDSFFWANTAQWRAVSPSVS